MCFASCYVCLYSGENKNTPTTHTPQFALALGARPAPQPHEPLPACWSQGRALGPAARQEPAFRAPLRSRQPPKRTAVALLLPRVGGGAPLRSVACGGPRWHGALVRCEHAIHNARPDRRAVALPRLRAALTTRRPPPSLTFAVVKCVCVRRARAGIRRCGLLCTTGRGGTRASTRTEKRSERGKLHGERGQEREGRNRRGRGHESERQRETSESKRGGRTSPI